MQPTENKLFFLADRIFLEALIFQSNIWMHTWTLLKKKNNITCNKTKITMKVDIHKYHTLLWYDACKREILIEYRMVFYRFNYSHYIPKQFHHFTTHPANDTFKNVELPWQRKQNIREDDHRLGKDQNICFIAFAYLLLINMMGFVYMCSISCDLVGGWWSFC